MRPFATNAFKNERCIFNYSLSRARRVVEKAFGILANQWRLYHHHLYLDPDNVTTVVKATVVLHNILTLTTDKVCTLSFYHDKVVDNREKICDNAFEDLTKQGNLPAKAVNDVRNYFTDYLNSDHCSVEWQNDCA